MTVSFKKRRLGRMKCKIIKFRAFFVSFAEVDKISIQSDKAAWRLHYDYLKINRVIFRAILCHSKRGFL